jgi:hypothetical protein
MCNAAEPVDVPVEDSVRCASWSTDHLAHQGVGKHGPQAVMSMQGAPMMSGTRQSTQLGRLRANGEQLLDVSCSDPDAVGFHLRSRARGPRGPPPLWVDASPDAVGAPARQRE